MTTSPEPKCLEHKGLTVANIAGRIADARRELMWEAGRRWVERRAEREAGLRRLVEQGPGAADPPVRQMLWTQRQANKAAMGLPAFTERVIGTRDFTAFAPSTQAAAAAASVARITTIPDGGYIAQGVATGLLLPDSLLLTNHHVFPDATYAAGYAANFKHVADDRGLSEGVFFELDPQAFYLSDPQFDFAIVAVKPKGLKGEDLAAIESTRLIETIGKVLTGMAVDIIQHPEGGPRQFAVTNNRLVDIMPEGFLHYETDTERGSSGSPVYNTDWEIIALHHSAVPDIKDGRILTRSGVPWAEGHPDSDIRWVANEGTRVSRIVDALRKVHGLDPEKQARLQRLLASTTDVFESSRSMRAATAVADIRNSPMTGNLFNFSGPVTIHAYAPQPEAALPSAPTTKVAAGAVVQPVGLVEEKALVFDPNYVGRTGYNDGFLGVSVPLPTVDVRAAELYTVRDYKAFFDEYRNVPELKLVGLKEDDALILHYHHFSLAFNKKYRMCMWTASNCDYREIERTDTRKRSELGGENWRLDPRVPVDIQLKNADIYAPGKNIDRGHIVRREDNCWGAAGLPTDYANSDTYHWPNCTPQHEAFNQENPKDEPGVKGIWGQFEGALAAQISRGGGQATIFSGPVLSNFFAAVEIDGVKVHIPKYFWKVVVVPDRPVKKPKLLVYGYLFSQVDVVNKFGFGIEALTLPEFERRRVSLEKISEMTGVRFPEVVVEGEQSIATPTA